MIKKIFLPSVSLLFKRLGIALVLLTITRLLFWWMNWAYFTEVSPLDFILGLRFDASVIAYTCSVFIVLSLLPFGFEKYKTYRIIQTVFFFLPVGICVFMNLADIEYFKFIFRRTTFDVIRFFSSPESDGWRLMWQFTRDFWYVGVLFVLLMFFAYWWYKRISLAYVFQLENWKVKSVWLLIVSGLLILAGRGGLQLTPISLVDAGFGTNPKKIPLVLNTPFSVMITAFQQNHKPVFYFSSRAASEQYFSLAYDVKPAQVNFKGRNVVVLILESFGREYIGYYNKKGGYTPFLDSLLQHSYVFPNSFANGKQSIDAVPAIISGLPAMMQDPFTYSVYSGNRIPSLALYFKNQGYVTQFFHGGNNGTMGFEAFCEFAGVDEYYGKDEYSDVERDYDGNWGIFDEPYLKYCAKMLSKNDKPFLSLIFSLSSHHPYTIPKQYQGRFPKGTYEIHESIGYADYALREFFTEAKKKPWFNNTLFVITADHTAQSQVPFYQNGMGIYAAPIAFYDPQQKLKGVDSTVVQHIDLFPTLIAMTGGSVHGKFFGRNAFDKGVQHDVINYNYGLYYYYNTKDSLQVIFDGDKVWGVYDYPKDSAMKVNKEDQLKPWLKSNTPVFKAKIQAYYQNMEENTLDFEMK